MYLYEVIGSDGKGGERFEVMQKMADEPLTKHPETDEPVRRVITAPFVATKYTERAMNKAVSDDKNLERLGFTKYVKSGDGPYEKRAGKGPDHISRD
jgi:hypothetical protein